MYIFLTDFAVVSYTKHWNKAVPIVSMGYMSDIIFKNYQTNLLNILKCQEVTLGMVLNQKQK